MLRTTLNKITTPHFGTNARIYARMLSSRRVRTTYEANTTNSLSLQPLRRQHERPSRQLRGFFTPQLNRMTNHVSSYLPLGLQKKMLYMFYLEEAEQPIIDKMEALERKILKSKNTKNIDHYTKEKIELLRNNIEEHAYRRVDLYFHLLTAVWNKRVKIIKQGGADYQHGIGSIKYGTQACHSSPFTNLAFERIPSRLSWLTGTEVSLKGTHFNDALNATMELPADVNQFDTHFEGAYGTSRHILAGMNILNRCAAGEINPIDGIKEFLQVMDSFFNHFDEKHIQGKSNIKHPEAMATVWEYQRRGTFSMCSPNSLQPSLDYIAMTLGMSKNKVRLAMVCPRLFQPHFRRIQDEIYANRSEPRLTEADGAGNIIRKYPRSR